MASERQRDTAIRALLGAILTVLAAGALLPVAAAAQPPGGRLTELSGGFACFSLLGSEDCLVGRALGGAGGAAVSPDGRNVYIASNDSSAVAVFRRNAGAGGTVSQLHGQDGCVSRTGRTGCATGRGLFGSFSLAVSPDGKNLYVASVNAVAVFSRDSKTGALRQLSGDAGCISQNGEEGCTKGRALNNAGDVTVSPDGSYVYVASVGSNAVAVFAREPLTGQLVQGPGPLGCVSLGGTEDCLSGRALGGAFGVAVSPDGRNAYVASLNDDAVAVFDRDAGTGALIQLPGLLGCLSEKLPDCSGARATRSPNRVAISPDGSSVYVTGSVSGGIATFIRDKSLGSLTQVAGTRGCVTLAGGEGCGRARAMGGAFGVAVSDDGRNVYAGGLDGIGAFARSSATGALDQLPGGYGCTNQGGSQGCATGRGLAGSSDVAISQDGLNAYVPAAQSNALTVFVRDPQRAALRVSVAGVPRRCTPRRFRARVAVAATLPIQTVNVYVDRRRLRAARRTRVAVSVPVTRLRVGRHRLRVLAVDAAGNRRQRQVRFDRCALRPAGGRRANPRRRAH